MLRARHVPIYRFPEDAAAAMVGLARYRVLRDRPVGKTKTFRCDVQRARRAIAAARRARRTMLSAREVGEVLAAYGFPMAPSRLTSSSAEAQAAAEALGYPVVLKAASASIVHKTDQGGVKLDLRNAGEVARAYTDLVSRLKSKDRALKIQVQRMIVGGRETILGMTRDPQFGPVLMFGLGGIFVEVMRDISVRVHPLTDVGARDMIERIKGYPLLAGARGEKKVDLGFLEESLLRLSQLTGDLEDELAEIDLNPLIVTESRKTSFVVDARIALSGA